MQVSEELVDKEVSNFIGKIGILKVIEDRDVEAILNEVCRYCGGDKNDFFTVLDQLRHLADTLEEVSSSLEKILD